MAQKNKKRPVAKRRTAAQKRKNNIKNWSGQKKAAAFLFALLGLFAAFCLIYALPQGIFEQKAIVPLSDSNSKEAVHAINVGQGAAILLENNGSFALLDAGIPDYSTELVSYLKNAGVKQLEYLIMSHPHTDHIGAMEAVINAFEVNNFVLPDLDAAPLPTNKIFMSLMQSANDLQLNSFVGKAGDVYPLGEGELKIIHGGLPSDNNLNLLSLGVMYRGGQLSVLFTGDGEKQNEKAMLESGYALSADVYIAAHHGSSTSNTEPFIQAVAPHICLISCGQMNKYGHPHFSVLKTFEDASVNVFRTDELGCVVVKPAENGFAVGASKQDIVLNNAA